MNETLERQIQLLEQHLTSQPHSPRFVELASCYLEAGRAQDALSLCDRGLAHHPFYSTAHLVKGKTLLALNMRAEARREFEFVHSFVPNSDAVAHYLKQIPPTADETLFAEAPQHDTATVAPAPTAETPQTAPEPATQEQDQSPEQVLSQFTEIVPGAPVEEVPTTPETTQQAKPEISQPPAEEAAEEPPSEAPSEEPFGIPMTEVAPQEPETFRPAESSSFEEPTMAESATGPETPAAGESLEEYSERKRSEWAGLENSMSLEEYLYGEQSATPQPDQSAAENASGVATESSDSEDPFAQLSQMSGAEPDRPAPTAEPSEPESSAEDPFAALRQQEPESTQEQLQSEEPPQEKDRIEELAEKLQNAKKITPVINLSDKRPVSPEEAESSAGSGFVTPTLAEIYAKQGWYDDAIKAYKALAGSKPAEREKYEARIRELEELKKAQGSEE